LCNQISDKSEKSQEILQDVRNGKPRPWRRKKVKNLILADSLHRLGEHKKAHRVWWCSTCLAFRESLEGVVEKVLESANFCRERLCPMCQWRKSLKIFYQTGKVMDVVQQRYENLVPIFLTLTLKNCTATELLGKIDEILKGWVNFTRHWRIRKRVKGWFRALEVTYDGDEYISQKRYDKGKGYYDKIGIRPGDKNPNFDTFHPHIHAILLVDKSYFRGKDYMQTAEWVQTWRTSMGLDYDPVCDVRVVKNQKGKRKEIAEVAKYTLKDSEFLTKNKDLTDRLVKILGEALKNRRLFAFGGLLKVIAKELGTERPDEGDLIHIDDETVRADIATVLTVYRWHFGLANYIRHEVIVAENENG